MRKPRLQPHLVWHCYLLAAICGLLAAVWPWQAISCLALLAMLDSRLWHLHRLALIVICFAAPLFYAQHELVQSQAIVDAPPAWLNGSKRFCANIKSVQGQTDGRLRILLANVSAGPDQSLPGICQWTWQEPLFIPIKGQRICLERPVRPVRGFANSETDSWQTWLFSQQILWRAWSEKAAGNPEALGEPDKAAKLRADLQEKFVSALSEDGKIPQSRAILAALLFGDRSHISQKTADLFAKATLAHSLALSGQHLAIAMLAGLLLILGASRILPDLYLRMPKRLLVFLPAIPLAILYLWLGNSPASLLRAFAMLAFAAFCLLRGKTFTGIDLVCFALLAILACNPLAVFDAGLQLSALCVMVIVLSAPAIGKMLPENTAAPSFRKALLKNLLLLFLISLAIQTALLPLSLTRFQIAGFWFPLNLVWLPCLGLIVLPFAALGLILCLLPSGFAQHLAGLAVDIAALPADWLLCLLHFLERHALLSEPALLIPHWTAFLAFMLLVPTLAVIFGTHLQKTRKVKICLCLGLILLGIGPLLRLENIWFARPSVEAIDVGQGQAVLLNLPQATRILIDGGGSYRDRFDPGKTIVAPLLTDNSPPRLAAIINTHPDLDHLGGLLYIASNFETGALFENGRDAPEARKEKWQMLRKRHRAISLTAGDKITIGDPQAGLALEVLHPPKGRPDLAGNGASLILRLVKNGKGLAIFCGDAEKEALKYALANGDVQADVVFAPHHGSNRNFLPAFYEKARPRLVIACCGFMNRWHYPGRILRNWLADKEIRLLDTGSNGRIKAFLDDCEESGYQVMRK